jgi:tetratricopeptide (TPR) repeat protein
LRRLALLSLTLLLVLAWPARAGETEDAQKILSLYASGDMDAGDTLMTAFLAAHPTSTRRCELLLAGGRAPQPFFEAIRRLRRTVEACQNQPEAPQALADVVRLNHLSGQDLAAFDACRDFLAQYPEHELAPQVLLLQGALEMQYQGGRLAGNSYALFLSRYPENPQAVLALVGVADAKVKHGDWAGAHRAYLQALQAGPDALDMPKVLFYLGQSSEMMADEPRARHYYEELVRLYGDTAYAARARDRLESVLSIGHERMRPPPDTSDARFSAQAGVFNSLAEADRAAQSFIDAGHKVRYLMRDEHCVLLVGEFGTETDARIFAEELLRRYHVRAVVVPLSP